MNCELGKLEFQESESEKLTTEPATAWHEFEVAPLGRCVSAKRRIIAV